MSEKKDSFFLLPDLFNLHSKIILKKLEDLTGFIFFRHNINNMRYTDNIVLMENSERQMKEHKVIIDSKKK